jgi:2-haloacid dehalogenase
MIDTVIFDLGGVLIDWNPRYLFRKIFTDEQEMEHFLTHICSPDWNEEQDAGRSLAEATQWLVERHPEYETQIRAYYGRWEEMLGGVFDEAVEALRKLTQETDYRVYALTNWSGETFKIALQKYDFLHWFDGIVVSGDEKMRKPSPEFYQILLNRYNVDPQNALFLDDNLRNIEAARKLGVHATHITDPKMIPEVIRGLSQSPNGKQKNNIF